MRGSRCVGGLVVGLTIVALARVLPAQGASPPAIPRQAFGVAPSPLDAREPTATVTAPAADANPAADEPAVPTSYLRQPTFAIPFNVGPEIVEVQLYVSIDRGASWHLYAQQKPDARRFRFRASRDGEFWFTSRTVDRGGQGRPATVTKPERRVIVDSRQPQVNVQATVTADGQVQASWDVDDEYLAPQTFRIGYRTDTQSNWQLVTAPPLQVRAGQPAVGQVAWRPAPGARSVQIHVEVADAAGNWGVVEKLLPWAPAAGGANAAGSPPSAPGSLVSAVPIVPPTGGGADNRPPVRSPLSAENPGYDAGGLPRTNASVGPAGSNAGGSTAPATSATGSSATGSSATGSSATGSSATGSLPSYDSGPSPVSPPGGGDLPGNERPRMSASRRFALEYDIESAGPGGVADVELWMTTDRGATWTKYGVDPDKTSPMEVEVAADGIYGVRIVVISGSGLASSAPRPNDPADLWVGVDTVRPTVQFSSVSYGEGAKAGLLDIRWVADDQRFGPRPITLSYAETSAGPWTTVAAGLPNSGQYYWSVDPHVPKKVVLRIEARDEAGNFAQHELVEPISLQGLSPAARVRGIQPTAP